MDLARRRSCRYRKLNLASSSTGGKRGARLIWPSGLVRGTARDCMVDFVKMDYGGIPRESVAVGVEICRQK